MNTWRRGRGKSQLIILASLGHLAMGMCAGRAFATATKVRPARSMAIFSGLAILPDADYLVVALGAPNEGPIGHRGAAHSLVLVLLAAGVALMVAGRARLPAGRLALTVALVVASHAVLDAMTGGGSRGVPLLWPLSFHRFEAPWRPIPNAPCGLAYISHAGLAVAATELVQFSPLLLYALGPWPGRWNRSLPRSGSPPKAHDRPRPPSNSVAGLDATR
jgi:inner membrane protein